MAEKTEAVFYDRKHGCEVYSSQIVPINAVVTLAVTEDDGEERDAEKKTILSAFENRIGVLGYKSPECSDKRNWDRFLNYADLVFIRFEFAEDSE